MLDEPKNVIPKGTFNNHVDKILMIFYPLPPSVDIFYVLNVDKFGKF